MVESQSHHPEEFVSRQMNSALSIKVKGIVQGVGFRPFVYHLARENHLTGWVLNSSSGVEIEVTGSQMELDTFASQLSQNPPPLAKIESIQIKQIEPEMIYTTFEIRESISEDDEFMPISPDICTCEQCLAEMNDPNDRRYRYPFINCTNCGPRFSIIENIPYDRPKTTMASFTMCSDCLAEYMDPSNRRFHAQPIACPQCGPHIALEQSGHVLAEKEQALQLARNALREGKIIALKGLGGYQIVCDAGNANAVNRIRNRKKRSDKPFALMANELVQIEKFADITPQERQLLQSSQHPIVLLQKKADIDLAESIAPGQSTLGFMLSYTPLHHLLLEPEDGFPDIFVMTSGNMSEEPIAYKDADARDRLESIADFFLVHNRPIHMRVDDSVTRIINSRPFILRRARGYAPDFLGFPFASQSIFAAGAELKNSFCLTRENQAYLSHHIGDLENFETLQSFEEGVRHYEKLFRINPQILACDLHPDYLATRYAITRAENEKKPLYFIQHHHAHLAACLAENKRYSNEPVIGLCFDGTGYGSDQAIWGGEVLIGAYQQFVRRFHLKYVPLAGGDISVRSPARMALAHLWSAGLDWQPEFACTQALCMEERTALRIQLEKQINSPFTSSMGRLFDAASAFIGVRQQVNYEGQAAIEMETIVAQDENGFYSFDIDQTDFDPAPFWKGLIHDYLSGTSQAVMAARFHNSIAQLALQTCCLVREEESIDTVALSGGVWQNKVLLTNTIDLLQAADFNVLWHTCVPTNDGGIAYGQACIAANVHSLTSR